MPTLPAAAGTADYAIAPVTSLSVSAGVERLSDGTARITEIRAVNRADGPVQLIDQFRYFGPNTYGLSIDWVGDYFFGPKNFMGSTSAFDTFRLAQDGGTVSLELARKTIGIDLSYSTFGIQASIFPDPQGTSFISTFAAGSITPWTQVPKAGVASFFGIVDGYWIDGTTTRRLFGSTATASVNFAASQFASLTLDLKGRSDPFGDFISAAITPLGVFGGTGRILAGNQDAEGTFASTAGYSGSFAGHFFGSYATEFGMTFRLTGPAGQAVVGVAAFKRTS